MPLWCDYELQIRPEKTRRNARLLGQITRRMEGFRVHDLVYQNGKKKHTVEDIQSGNQSTLMFNLSRGTLFLNKILYLIRFAESFLWTMIFGSKTPYQFVQKKKLLLWRTKVFWLISHCKILTDFETLDVMEHCTLHFDLSDIPKPLFDRRSNSKELQYYHIAYELVLKPQSACLEFKVVFNDVSYGVAAARYY